MLATASTRCTSGSSKEWANALVRDGDRKERAVKRSESFDMVDTDSSGTLETEEVRSYARC